MCELAYVAFEKENYLSTKYLLETHNHWDGNPPICLKKRSDKRRNDYWIIKGNRKSFLRLRSLYFADTNCNCFWF
jgi:hypothetical protein